MHNIDLHALRVFDEIYKTASLSRTADRLDLSQPAISVALGKLRKHYDDPLFVRVGNEMRPTPHAAGMIDGVRAAMVSIETTLAYRLAFDPASAERTFRVAMTDIGQIVVLPPLLDALASASPGARLDITTIGERTPHHLEGGEIDLVVGFVPSLLSAAGFFQQALFQERFICLTRSGHPRIRSRPTLEQFEAELHVQVVTSGTGHLIIDRVLEERKIKRRVAVRIPNFLGLATLIGGTDYLCTMPRRAGLVMARNQPVAAWSTPFELPDYTVKQHWHERQARDPGNRWLRGLMTKLFNDG